MGYIYVIQNIENNMIYVGQTTRSVQIRWKEHRVKRKNRLINDSIKQFGVDKFRFILTKECENKLLDEEESSLIHRYNCLYPNGYNSTYETFFTTNDNRKGGLSDVGHDKHSFAMKKRYNTIQCLKDLGNIPRGISYWKRGTKLEGFKVRKVGIKSKDFVSSPKKNALEQNLENAKKYLENALTEKI